MPENKPSQISPEQGYTYLLQLPLNLKLLKSKKNRLPLMIIQLPDTTMYEKLPGI